MNLVSMLVIFLLVVNRYLSKGNLRENLYSRTVLRDAVPDGREGVVAGSSNCGSRLRDHISWIRKQTPVIWFSLRSLYPDSSLCWCYT